MRIVIHEEIDEKKKNGKETERSSSDEKRQHSIMT